MGTLVHELTATNDPKLYFPVIPVSHILPHSHPLQRTELVAPSSDAGLTADQRAASQIQSKLVFLGTVGPRHRREDHEFAKQTFIESNTKICYSLYSLIPSA